MRKSCFCFLWGFPYSPQQRAERQKDASGRGSMSAKDCHVKTAIFFFTAFPLAVLFSDVVLYAVSLFFVIFHLFYGFLMYLVVEIIVHRRGIDCNATGYGAVYVPVFWVLSFRDFTWFGFGYVILATVAVLALLFVLRPNQSGDDPRQQ
jgi:uncharacterized membrane protein